MNKEELIKVCNRNIWLAEDNEEYNINDYVFYFLNIQSIDGVIDFFEHGNHAIRTGVIYDGRLALIQQVNGGDEYLAIKRVNGKLVKFESISMELILERRGRQGTIDYIRYNLLQE